MKLNITIICLAVANCLLGAAVITNTRAIRERADYNRMIIDQVYSDHTQLFRQAFERIEDLEERTRP